MSSSSPAHPGGTPVGWLGLGAMGSPMARRLAAAGHSVLAYDPHPDRSISTPGLVYAASAAAAAVAPVVCLMVSSPAQAEQAVFGPDGAAPLLHGGDTIIVLSTLGPAWVRELGDRLADGVRVVDAPVSGGVTRAIAGSLLIMAAGAQDGDLALLEALGEAVVVGDRAGLGQSMKLVNQVLCGIHIAAAAEALALADAIGIDPSAAWDTVRRGAAASFMLDDRGERMVSGQRTPVRSALSLFVKDLGLVLDEAAAAGQPADLTAAAAALFAAAAEDGGPTANAAAHDDSALYDHLRARRSRSD